MKFFTLGCGCCNGADPLIAVDPEGNEVLRMFRSKTAAQVEASEMKDNEGNHPHVVEVEVKRV